MLWSLIKILVFVVAVAVLTYGATYLLETEGGIQVTVGGTEYTLEPLQSAIAALLLLVVVWVVLKLLSLLVAILRFLAGDETALSRWSLRGRERRGYQALADGMMALASGEGRLAMTKATKAERYLSRPELTNLLIAQAAEMTGDTTTASETYKRLIADDRTRFVGVRGLMKQKLAEGDSETARKLAEKAFALRPRHEETQDVLLKLQAQAHDWAGARSTLNAKLKSGSLPRDVYARREAVLALSEANDIIDPGASTEQREQAIEANRLSPDLIPAAAMAARSYIEKGKPKNAGRVLRKAWEVMPHPDLASAFAEIVPDETPVDRLKRFELLTTAQPNHVETRLLKAELNIVAEDFPEARRAIAPLVDDAPDARVYTMMAAIERGEGASEAVVQGWLARALTAPRGPQWTCDNCQHVQVAWAPVCEQCGAFDTLTWRRPENQDVEPSTGAAMLPLIMRPNKPAERPETEDIVMTADAAEDDADAAGDDTTEARS